MAHAQLFVYDGTNLQDVTLSAGTYEILVAGAQGGNYTAFPGPNVGGLGAEMGGQFTFGSSVTLDILVGGIGGSGDIGPGGGGTFVVETGATETPLVVAGGGGGAFGISAGVGGNGTVGNSGTGGGAGGGEAGGGGGYLGNGGNAAVGTGGMSFSNGGAGGTSSNDSGGYGGGDGGDVGGLGSEDGGGGSYLDPSVVNAVEVAGENSGNGLVFIEELSEPPPMDVPEPSTWALMLGGLGLLAFRRARRV